MGEEGEPWRELICIPIVDDRGGARSTGVLDTKKTRMYGGSSVTKGREEYRMDRSSTWDGICQPRPFQFLTSSITGR